MNDEPQSLKLWQEKLEHFLQEEALCSDAGRQFTIKKGIEEATAKVRLLQDSLREQQAEIASQTQLIAQQQEVINKLVIYSMASFYYDRLKELYEAQTSGAKVFFQPGYTKDLMYLRDNGYIEITGIRQLREGQDFSSKVKMTDAGLNYVRLRDSLEVSA